MLKMLYLTMYNEEYEKVNSLFFKKKIKKIKNNELAF